MIEVRLDFFNLVGRFDIFLVHQVGITDHLVVPSGDDLPDRAGRDGGLLQPLALAVRHLEGVLRPEIRNRVSGRAVLGEDPPEVGIILEVRLHLPDHLRHLVAGRHAEKDSNIRVVDNPLDHVSDGDYCRLKDAPWGTELTASGPPLTPKGPPSAHIPGRPRRSAFLPQPRARTSAWLR